MAEAQLACPALCPFRGGRAAEASAGRSTTVSCYLTKMPSNDPLNAREDADIFP